MLQEILGGGVGDSFDVSNPDIIYHNHNHKKLSLLIPTMQKPRLIVLSTALIVPSSSRWSSVLSIYDVVNDKYVYVNTATDGTNISNKGEGFPQNITNVEDTGITIVGSTSYAAKVSCLAWY